MVDQWLATKPQYLTKIRARAGLQNCGDVNAIGRVHTFLERANIINVDATPTRRKPNPNNNSGGGGRRRRVRDFEQQLSDEGDDDQQNSSDGEAHDGALSHGIGALSSGRRRRVRDEKGNWVYEDEYYGGRVISHDVVVRRAEDADDDYNYSSGNSDDDYYSGGRNTKKRQRRGRSSGDGSNGAEVPNGTWWTQNSEFRLIPCRTFADGCAAASAESKGNKHPDPPFSVSVSAAALALMDLHAHLMYTEIIGLLGGRYNAEKRELAVDVAFPCRSTSTTTECEMDPASEIEARRVFSASGRQVVGWFHSHPTFDAMPSVRDIHNQHAYQLLCRRSNDKVEPFVGFIVSPPGGAGPFGVSDISAFYVMPKHDASSVKSGDVANRNDDGSKRDKNDEDDEDDEDEDIQGTDGIPYHVSYTVCSQNAVPPDLIGMMTALAEEHAHMEQRADLAKRFKRKELMTMLEKLVLSMRSHWGEDVRQQWDDSVSQHLRPLLHTHFCKSSKQNNGRHANDA
ncbi:hypothetical protein GGI12_001383 [Dipsacomyces acuminosporus]|nr:hypothetical protein GGI12_001383 [Dipsacomyces acuminosporus]